MATTSTPIHTPPRSSSVGHNKSSAKKRISNDYLDEQIRRLELEGNYLRSSISDSLTRSQQITPGKKANSLFSGKLALSLSDLVDSPGGETRKPTTCSKELEGHFDTNEHLHPTLLHSQEDTGSLYPFQYASTRALLERLKAPASVPSSSSALQKGLGLSELKPLAGKYQSSSSNHMQDELLDLQTKLEDSNTVIEKQREQFHRTLEDIRRKYENDAVAKDALLRAKERESMSHADVVAKLQQCSEQLQLTNRTQEQTISDLQEKLEVLHREQRLVELAIGQIRGQVLDQERKRGQPFYEGTSLLQQDVSSFVRSVEKCIQELDMEVELKKDHIKEMTAKFERGKDLFQEKEKKLQQDFQLRLSELVKEHKEALDVKSEQMASLEKQLSHLKDEAVRQKSQLEHQIQLKDASLSDLEGRFALAKEDLTTERKAWQTKNQNLDAVIENNQQEIMMLRMEKNSKIQEISALELKYAELQNTFSKTKTSLESALEQVCRLKERETSLASHQNLLEEETKKKTVIVEDLERKMEIMRQDNETHLKQMMANVEKEEGQNSERREQALLIQLNALTEKCHRLTLDLELTRSNHQNLQEKYSDLRTSHDILCGQLETATNAKEKLNGVLSERLTELARTAHERDASSKSAELSSFELSSLRSQKDRLVVQLEEREKNFIAIKEQNDRLTALLDSHTQAGVASRKERDEFERKLMEAEAELKTKTLELTSLKRRTSSFERLEEAKQRLEKDLEERKIDLGVITSAKDSVTAELKDARHEISDLKEQVGILQRSLERKDGSLEKDLSRMLQKLRSAEHELKLAKKALKTHDEVDGRALEVASKMQKEVTAKRSEIDILYSKTRQLQDILDSAEQEKKALEESNQALADMVQRTAQQRDQLAEELRLYVVQHGQLQSEIVHLQAALQKSSVERVSVQRQADQYFQDITELKLKHQLELKELERIAAASWQSDVNAIKAAVPPRSQQFASARKGRNTEIEYPTSVKPAHQNQREFASTNANLDHRMEEVLHSSPGRDSRPVSAIDQNEYDSTSVTIQSTSSNLDSIRRNLQVSRKWIDEKPTKDYSAVNPGASVFDLLTGQPSAGNSSQKEYGSHSHSRRSKRTAFDPDTKALYRRLEKRIETLTKMGGSLQKENQEIANGMKDHGK